MKLQNGFTLIEVMITVGIISILAAIALPSYTDYVMRGRIPDATSGLSARRLQAEQHFQDNRTYLDVGASINPACVADNTGTNFNFLCTVLTATTYRVQATGKGKMIGFIYTIDQTGARATPGVSPQPGWIANLNCWVTTKDGMC